MLSRKETPKIKMENTLNSQSYIIKQLSLSQFGENKSKHLAAIIHYLQNAKQQTFYK